MNTKVTVSNRPKVLTVSSAGVTGLGNLTDVNVSGATDGAVPVSYTHLTLPTKA